MRNQIFVRGATGGLGIGFVKPDAPLGHPYVVTELTPGGPAAIRGAVKPGDTILSVDGKPITQLDPAHVRELIVGAAGSSVVLGLGPPASMPVAPPAPAPAPAPLVNVALNRAETGGIGLGFNRSNRFMSFLCRCVLHSALVCFILHLNAETPGRLMRELVWTREQLAGLCVPFCRRASWSNDMSLYLSQKGQLVE